MSDFARWREILYMLVLRDLKARTKQAYLGYFWIFIQPLLLTGVFSFLVQQVLGRSDLSDVPYPVFLMAGVIPWQFFANSVNESAESLVKNVDLVRQVLDEDLRGERENREVEISIGDMPVCEADPLLLRQVYVNLLSNALKFTCKQEHARIEVGARCENGSAVYFVKDNGAGFDQQYVHKLFGVFQRLHRIEDFAGTGVGLAIVQRVITRHGGRIWAESAGNGKS